MKKNKKGFTLVELLAVIVILAIIMVIAGTNVLNTKKNANIEEAKKMEKMIEDLGPGIYSHESITNSGRNFMNAYNDAYNYNTSFCISIDELHSAGYLESDTINDPSGNGTCDGYLEVVPSATDNIFKGYISCSVYTTHGYDEDKICSFSFN